MTPDQEKRHAFAAVLENLAIRPVHHPDVTHAWIKKARAGFYASGSVRPAFLGSYFRMTEQEWDALRALIYG